jgi:hypothetical protein
MKKLFILILILFPLLVHGENLKLSELTAVTSAGVESEDLLLVTINPTDPVAESDGGTRASRKVTLGNLLLWMATQPITLIGSTSGSMSITVPATITPYTLTLPSAAPDSGWTTGLLGFGPDGTGTFVNVADLEATIPISGEITTEHVACWSVEGGNNLLKACGLKTTDNSTATHLLCKDDSNEIENCTLSGLAISGTTSPTITVEAMPANATVNAAGEMTIDTTTDQIRWYGTEQRQLSPKLTFSVVVPSVADTDDMLIMKAPYGMTITALDCIVSAATSATINIQECDSAGANCVDTATSDLACDTDGANTTTLNNAVIDSGDWLKLDVASISGTPGALTVTVTYTIVAD